MSGFIPKEKLTAYQRWELAAFDEAEQAAANAESTAPPEDEAAIALPTAEEIERIHGEAQASGYAAGLEEGRAEARAEAARIAALHDHLRMQLQEMDQEISEQLLAVAIEIAGQVLRQSLRIKPELLLPVVREAITTLPLHHGHPTLFLHPDDASLIRQHLGDQLNHNGWRIFEDVTIDRGGCRIESGASEVDATLQTRWRRVLDAIGTQADWLDDAT